MNFKTLGDICDSRGKGRKLNGMNLGSKLQDGIEARISIPL